MRRLVLFAALFVAPFLSGCKQESKIEDERTIATPGGQTEIRHTTEVEKSGDHRTDR